MEGANQVLGRRGEEIAEKYLRSNGYDVVEKNWRCRGGEIDLIVKKGTSLYFVEVKTRLNLNFGSPLLAIHAGKQRKLRRLAEIYLATRPFREKPAEVCLSCMGIFLDGDTPKIEWLPHAFGM